MPTLTLPDGARLAWDERAGAGPPIVLLHGILDGPDVWTPLADALAAAGRRVILVHDRAHGDAEPWRAGMDWSPLAAAEDARALLCHMAPHGAIWPGGAHFVGHSRGATTASWLAVEHPELVRSLAVVASPPQASEVFRAHFRDRISTFRDAREADALRYLATMPEEDFPAMALRRYRGPALVVEAARDPLYAPTQTLFWRAFLPFADFERVEAGHDVPREMPAWLAARLLAFFGKVEA